MIATFLALALAASSQAEQRSSTGEHEIVFTRGSQLGWSMEGRTVVQEGDPANPDLHFPATEPTIRDQFCVARRNGIEVRVYREGRLWLDIAGVIVEDGRERRVHAYELRSLVLDGATWEVRSMADADHSRRFSDIAYAGPEVVYGQMTGPQVAVRRPPGDVWLSISVLADDLLRSSLLRLGFRADTEALPVDEGARSSWIDVPLTGLGGALAWCQRAMASPNALRLHPVGVAQAPPH